VADFDHQQAFRGEKLRRLGENDPHRIEAVVAAGQRNVGLMPVFGRQFLHRHRRDVRRIADDQVVGLFGQVRQ
jgi:hypothetical protein